VFQVSCYELREATKELGIDVVANAINNRQTHQFGQIVAGQGLRKGHEQMKSDMVKMGRYAMSGYPKHGGFAFGYLHGAVWYVAGKTKESPWDRVRYELCTNATYEFVSVCLHGLGHAGFIRVLDEYDECSSVPFIRASDLPVAYEICAQAPSSMLELRCADGFYHGVAEELDPQREDVNWMYPCNTMELPFQEICFKWLFFQVPLTLLPGLPFRGYVSRRKSFEKEGGLQMCTKGAMPNERIVLACIFGMSSVVFSGFWQYVPVWNEYYNSFVPEIVASKTPLVDWCARYLQRDYTALTSVELSEVDERRWLTCVTGSLSFIMSQMWRTQKVPMAERVKVCDQLLHVKWQSAALQQVSYELCLQRTRFSYLSYVRSDAPNATVDVYGVWSSDVDSSWDEWYSASVEASEYAMWPLYNYTYRQGAPSKAAH